jgi:DNA-binding SARP family transcriptional activator
MEFRILGGLEVEIEGRPVALGEPQQQIVLATLLLEPGRVVPVHRLVDAVWDERPPATAQKQIRNRVGILRRLLSEAGCGHATIVTERAGYRLAVDAARIDTYVFDEQIRWARLQRDAGLFADAAAGLRRALALWRGPLLEGLDSRG